MLSPHEIDSIVHSTLDRIDRKQTLEDSRLELKSDWSKTAKDHHRYARQIAGLCNAAHGGDVLLVVGVNEKNGAVGCDQEELGAWWRSVAAWFEDPPPEPHSRVIHTKGNVVVALVFDSTQAPLTVFVQMQNGTKIVPNRNLLEVPWRALTDARSATRRDLIEMLLPTVDVPRLEVLDAEVFGRQGDDGQVGLQLTVRTYVDLRHGGEIVIPDHRCAGYVQGQADLFSVPFTSVEALPTRRLHEHVLGSERVGRLEMAFEGRDQAIVRGPGPLTIVAKCTVEPASPLLDADVVLASIYLGLANSTVQVPMEVKLSKLEPRENARPGEPAHRWATSERTHAGEPAEHIGLTIDVEPTESVMMVNGTEYHLDSYIWVTVSNGGSGGSFEVRAREVTGLSGGMVDAAGAPFALAWENVIEPVQRIARSSAARIKLGSVAAKPFAFWFWLPASASWSPTSHAVGIQHDRAHVADEVRLVLDVQDIATDALTSFSVVIRFDPTTGKPDATVTGA